MCYQKVYIEDEIKDNLNVFNNNGFIVFNENLNLEEVLREDVVGFDRELNEDDSIDCDDDV